MQECLHTQARILASMHTRHAGPDPEILDENLRPRLKIETILLPRTEHTYVGRCDWGLEVSSPARGALAFMDGTRTCIELGQALGIPLSQIVALVKELDQVNLIDTHTSRISVHTRFHSPNANRASHDSDDSNDGAFHQLQAKLLPELSSTTWLKNVRDGGVGAVSRRSDWAVSIYGQSRIATLLYGILLSSGISRTSLYGGDERKKIAEEDLCAGFLHSGDIGLSFGNRTHELARELSLFPISSPSHASIKEGFEKSQHIMVSVGNPPADEVQRWMSEGVTHLFIDSPENASISVGPIVIPGQTPCARCIAMTREDQMPTWREIALQKLMSPPKEVPVAIAHHVAGVVALELLHFIDEGQSTLIGSTARVNYHRPISSEQQTFSRHPACGCNW